MTNYTIYISSNEHPRTINTPRNGRAYYTDIRVQGKRALVDKVSELLNAGERILEISTDLGTRVYL